ncbi:MAG: hypothetical protein ISR58_20065 [Anaerolineales bacterium]|nr:hypothetical protein [Chloroflexota bacterium]MBL6983482.1 hypothetical protein [Anaerolineales bacterium]
MDVLEALLQVVEQSLLGDGIGALHLQHTPGTFEQVALDHEFDLRRLFDRRQVAGGDVQIPSFTGSQVEACWIGLAQAMTPPIFTDQPDDGPILYIGIDGEQPTDVLCTTSITGHSWDR